MIKLFISILFTITPFLCMGQQINLGNTSWTGIDGPQQTDYKINFLTNGTYKVEYYVVSGNGLKTPLSTTGNWKQTGDSIYMETFNPSTNMRHTERRGVIRGNTMNGTGMNPNGSWNWSYQLVNSSQATPSNKSESNPKIQSKEENQNLNTPIQQKINLAGTHWRGIAGDKQQISNISFWDNGKYSLMMAVDEYSGRQYQGAWVQKGNFVQLTQESKSLLMTGVVEGNRIYGTAKNNDGVTWNWSYEKINPPKFIGPKPQSPEQIGLGSQNSNLGGISGAICDTNRAILVGQTLEFRKIGIPIGDASDTFNSEKDVKTRVFLKQVVRLIYSDPAKGERYLNSGQFMNDCVKTHRGF
jgi:hypothetical protein